MAELRCSLGFRIRNGSNNTIIVGSAGGHMGMKELVQIRRRTAAETDQHTRV